MYVLGPSFTAAIAESGHVELETVAVADITSTLGLFTVVWSRLV